MARYATISPRSESPPLEITSARGFSEQLTGLKVEHEYIEKPGLDHGTIIMGATPDVFRFFSKHVKAARR